MAEHIIMCLTRVGFLIYCIPMLKSLCYGFMIDGLVE